MFAIDGKIESIQIVIPRNNREMEMESLSDVSSIVSKQFGHLFPQEENESENFFEKLKKMQFFPKTLGKNCIHVKDLARLCYLTTFQEGEIKCPFTAEVVAIFQDSMEKSKNTASWFKKAIVPFALFSGFTYISFISLTDLSDGWKAGIAGTTGAISTLALQMLGLCITGTNPNSSKDADNLKQNTIQKVKGSYDEMAKELVAMHQANPEIAKAIANQMNLQQIFQAARNCYLNEMEVKAIFKYLKDAVLFVKGKRHLPRHHDLNLHSATKEV